MGTYCKAYTYHVDGRIFVRDDKGNIFDSHCSYFRKCFVDALTSLHYSQRRVCKSSYRYCFNYFYNFLRIFVDEKRYWEYKYDQDVFGEGMKRRIVFSKYILPRRWRAMRKKYGIFLEEDK